MLMYVGNNLDMYRLSTRLAHDARQPSYIYYKYLYFITPLIYVLGIFGLNITFR